MPLWIVCLEKFPLKNFSLIFHVLCKQEPCQHLLRSVFSVTSSLLAVHPFCLRRIPAHYVILPDFVSTNCVALMETINQFSTFWEMTYRLLLWRGRAGCDRKVLQHSKKDQEVSFQIRIMKANFTFTSWSMWSRFSLSRPSPSWINFQIDRPKSALGARTRFRASKVIQNNVVKNESPEGLYFHHEPLPNPEQVVSL